MIASDHQLGLQVLTSAIANEIGRMFMFAGENCQKSFRAVLEKDDKLLEEINSREEYIDYLNKEISYYISHLMLLDMSEKDAVTMSALFKITGNSDIKNYSEYLYDNAGESILAWVIEGAKKVIALNYQIPVPACVQTAIDGYRSQNDWLSHFIEDRCDVDDGFKESSSSLYQAYRNYCIDTNEYVRSTADFYFALESRSFERFVQNRKRYFKGLRIRTEDDAAEDFLT